MHSSIHGHLIKKKKKFENMKSPHYSLTVTNLLFFFSKKINLFIYLQYI